MLPRSMKRTRSTCASGRAGRCSETTIVHVEPLDGVEERIRRGRVDLRRRLVEQEQARLERERRRERDALQLAARQLGGPALGEVPGADQLQRLVDPRPDVGRRDADVLEAERDLVRDLRHHDLVLRILEDRRDVAGKLGRARLARVAAGHDDAPRERAAVEVRHEARPARAAGSTCRIPTGRTARCALLPRCATTRRAAPARRRRTRSEARRPRLEPQRTDRDDHGHCGEGEPVARTPRRARRARSAATAVATRLHRLGQVEPALERACEERREKPAPGRAPPAGRAERRAGRGRRVRAPGRGVSRARRRASTGAPSRRRSSSRSWSRSSA